MKCAEFMITDPPRIDSAATVGQAIETLIAQKLAALPVATAEGRYLGMFSAREMLSVILPKAVKLGHLVGDLGFMHDSLKDCRADLARVVGDPVVRHLEQSHPEFQADTEMMRALQLHYTGRNVIPVVEKDSRRLVGLSTRLHAMAVLMGTNNAR
jgi:CBS domain-containing protein